jgi:hypothetical protein
MAGEAQVAISANSLRVRHDGGSGDLGYEVRRSSRTRRLIVPETPPPKRRTRRRAAAMVALGLVAVLVLAVALAWAARRTLAREALVNWFEARGLPARAEVEAVGPGRLAARISLGDPNRPDFAAERVEVRYRLRDGQVEVMSATLTAPTLRARLGADGRPSFGALDAIIRDVLSRPRPPDAPLPDVRLERGRLLLATPWGSGDLGGELRFAGGRIRSLAVASQPTRLKGATFDLALGPARLEARERPDRRLDLSLVAPVAGRLGEGRVEGATLRAVIAAPHPDILGGRIDGAVAGQASLAGASGAWGPARLAAPIGRLSVEGRMRLGAKGLSADGTARAAITASDAVAGETRLKGLDIAATATGLAWTGAAGEARLQVRGRAADARAGDLTLTEVDLGAEGPLRFGAKGPEARLIASAQARGRYSGLGVAPMGPDPLAAIRRAARDVRIEAPQIDLTLTGDGGAVRLPRPITATAAGGGRAVLKALGGRPLIGPEGGSLAFVLAGGGLPEIEAAVNRLVLTEDGFEATGRLAGSGSLGLARDARVEAAGRVSLARGALSFAATDCVVLGAARLEFGESDVTDLAGRLCPTGRPMLSASNGAWRLLAQARDVGARAPFAQVRVSGGGGQVAAQGQGGRMAAQIEAQAGRLIDTAPDARFEALALSGAVTLQDFIWRADLAARLPRGPRVGFARVTHDGRLGLGVAVFETEPLRFAEGALQPADLSPLAGTLGPPVSGESRFVGRFDWSPEGASSSGRLSIARLNFQSPAGAVEGLRGEVAFSSLAPLAAAPGQVLIADTLRSTVLITSLRARFEIADTLLKVEGGEAEVGGGKVRIEGLEMSLTPGVPARGVLVLEGVQLHDLVEASPFGDRVELDAKVSGRVPFEVLGQKVRITGGELKADQPGRLAIQRTALTGVTASGEAPPAGAADPNATFTDFAYQAMEHLAFDALSATIASRPDGRLGVLFVIKGRHDPPTRQEIRLTPADIVLRRFMGKPLPLPSGTGVNLTLDTTLNLDDLIGDWSDWRRTRGSGPVQPEP